MQKSRALHFSVRHRPVLIAAAVCIGMFAWQRSLLFDPLSYFSFSSLMANSGPLIFAAMGLTVVFIVRGLDLSCGAIVGLVNVLVASQPATSPLAQIGLGVAAIGVGAAVGALNGFFIAGLGLPSVVVTLAMMFIIMGVNLLIMPVPGGTVASEMMLAFTGDAVADAIPAALIVICIGFLVWTVLRRSRLGTALYAVGSNEAGAYANGIDTVRTKFLAYMIAGAFYGAAGLFLSAQTTTGDPLMGGSMLLNIFAATVLGGTSLNGGRGGCLGTIFGALTLTLISSVLLNLNVAAYWTPIVEAGILILAVSIGSLSSGTLALLPRSFAGSLPWFKSPTARQSGIAASDEAKGWTPRPIPELSGNATRNWVRRNWDDLRLILPSWVLVGAIWILVALVIGVSGSYFTSILTLAVFLAVLGLGQGAVVTVGGFDLSVPYTMAFSGLLLASICNGSNDNLVWALPLVLVMGMTVGLFNGLGVVLFKFPAIIITLAANGVMQGICLLYTNGLAAGHAPPFLVSLFADRFLGLTPANWFLVAFVVIATWLLNGSVFGRRIMLVGSNARVARLSGVPVAGTTIAVYVLSGFCAALAGALLLGFSKVAFIDMGLSFQLPSIAAVLIGGTLATGGRSHYAGILGGAILLVAVGTFVTGADLPVALRGIVFGAVMLGAVLSLRDRSGGRATNGIGSVLARLLPGRR